MVVGKSVFTKTSMQRFVYENKFKGKHKFGEIGQKDKPYKICDLPVSATYLEAGNTEERHV